MDRKRTCAGQDVNSLLTISLSGCFCIGRRENEDVSRSSPTSRKDAVLPALLWDAALAHDLSGLCSAGSVETGRDFRDGKGRDVLRRRL